MLNTLHDASRQWASRPADERFTNLHDLLAHTQNVRRVSTARVVSSRDITCIPGDDNRGLTIRSNRTGTIATPTHWSFGQLCQRANAPAGYMRELPAPLAADCVNYGLQFGDDAAEVGLLLRRDGAADISAQAVTGPRYGRIWNSDVTQAVLDRFGDGTGRDTDWSVPGEFGQAVEITRANTTLYAGDRDMFIFLADEKNRVEIPNRRDGKGGTLARGFFISNSEVGAATLTLKAFLFDYACCNRIVWGAQNVSQIAIRHTANAPDRYLEGLLPALEDYSHGSNASVADMVKRAQALRCDRNGQDVNAFLAQRFGKRMAPKLQAIHMAEEGRPVETIWDASTAATAFARSIQWQDERVALETLAGEVLALAD